MKLTRRSALSMTGGAVVVAALGYVGWRRFAPGPAPVVAAESPPQSATIAADDPRVAERSLGDANAKTVVHEYFSLTCTHCAAFARNTMPAVEKDLIAPGKLRFVYHDFPLDGLALSAAMVARSLPPTQYHPFVTALMASQDRWAFTQGINNIEEIWKLAALAGMGRATFDKAIADDNLRNWILQQRQADQDHWKIDATPSFVINGQTYAGERSYDAFRKLLPEV